MSLTYKPSQLPSKNFRYIKSYNEPMLIQQSYYSPEGTPLKESSRQTPKSILKEPTSGSKPKKSIIINESLNETRKISQRSESPEIRFGNNPQGMASKAHSQSTQALRPYTATNPSSDLYAISDFTDSNRRGFENNRYKTDNKSFGSMEYQGRYGKSQRDPLDAPAPSKNSVFDRLSKLERAHVQRVNDEPEPEINQNTLYRHKISNASSIPSYSRGNDYMQSRSSQFENSQGFDMNKRRLSDTNSTLDNIETKIHDLEKNLDLYSRKLRESIEKQRGTFGTVDQLNRAYGESWGIKRGDTEQARHHEESKRSTQRPEDVNKRSKAATGQANSAREGYEQYRQDEGAKSSTRSNNGDISGYRDELKNEIQQLRDENRLLRSSLRGSKGKGGSFGGEMRKTLAEEIREKEEQLLNMIDNISGKLTKTMEGRFAEAEEGKRYQPNMTLHTFSKERYQKTLNDSITKTVNKNKPPAKKPDLDAKDYKVRKAYGAADLEKENTQILYEGLSTTYNGYHWNADKSLRLKRNI